MKTKEKRHSKFLERFWTHPDMRYSRLNKSTNSSIDIPLQNLDAHSLLAFRPDRGIHYRHDLPSATNSSPASSSLDLEWEHEYSNNHSWLLLPQELTIDEMSSEDDDTTSNASTKNTSNRPHCRTENDIQRKHQQQQQQQRKNGNSKISWSHISTPESLEWDINDDHQLRSEEDFFDSETIELLQEIEWLKNRALTETGEHLRETIESES